MPPYLIGAFLPGSLMRMLASRLNIRIALPVIFLALGASHLMFSTSTSFPLAFTVSFLIGITLVPTRILFNSALMAAATNQCGGHAQAALQIFSSIVVILVGLSADGLAREFCYLSGFAFIFVTCLLGVLLSIWRSAVRRADSITLEERKNLF